MKKEPIQQIINALMSLCGVASFPAAETRFSKLSKDAQDAIVWAVLANDGESPPTLSDAVKEEIRAWAAAEDAPIPASDCYYIERAHVMRPGVVNWKREGRFEAGAPWRDGRPVNDETMREELQGFRKTWWKFSSRVRCPNGEILPESEGGEKS